MKPIYTSSWATALPPTFKKIGISRMVPRNYPAGYRRIKELEPGPWFNSVTPLEYHKRFMAQLNALDAREVLQKIVLLADGAEAATLLGFESPNDPMQWCHRGQVAGWLHDKLKIEVREYGLEGCGCGWSHPKLFAKLPTCHNGEAGFVVLMRRSTRVG